MNKKPDTAYGCHLPGSTVFSIMSYVLCYFCLNSVCLNSVCGIGDEKAHMLSHSVHLNMAPRSEPRTLLNGVWSATDLFRFRFEHTLRKHTYLGLDLNIPEENILIEV